MAAEPVQEPDETSSARTRRPDFSAHHRLVLPLPHRLPPSRTTRSPAFPDGDPAKARADVGNALVNAIRETDIRRQKSAKAVAQALGYEGWTLLAESARGLKQPVIRTMGDVMSNMGRRLAIPRLLDLGLITSVFPTWTPDPSREILDGLAERMFEYTITPFGNAVLRASAELLGITGTNVAQFKALFDEAQSQPASALMKRNDRCSRQVICGLREASHPRSCLARLPLNPVRFRPTISLRAASVFRGDSLANRSPG